MEGMALILATAQQLSSFAPYVILTIFIVEVLRQLGKVSSQMAPYVAFPVAWVVFLIYVIGESGFSWTVPFRMITQGSEVAIGALALYDTVGKPIKKVVQRLVRRKKSSD